MAKFEEEKVINALHTEKAEEYVNKRPFIHLLGRNTIFIQKEFKDAILWALAEGRKEGYELGYNEKFENTCMKAEEFDKYLKLVKENELLKAKVRSLEERLKLEENTANVWQDLSLSDVHLLEYFIKLFQEANKRKRYWKKQFLSLARVHYE